MNPPSPLPPRDQLVRFMRRIYERRLTTTSGGNLSILDDDGNLWITPGGIDKGGLRPDDIVCIRPDGRREGRRAPSSEYPFHRSVYRMHPEVRAVVHAHPPATVAFSISGRMPDTALCPEIRTLCGAVGFVPYEVPGSEALGRRIGAAFAGGCRSVVLENHGACVIGGSLSEACARLELLDFCCRMQQQAMRLGGTRPVPENAPAAIPHAAGISLPGGGAALPRDAAEPAMRRQLADLTRRAWRQELFAGTLGVCAGKLDDGSLLLPDPTADRGAMTPDDFVRIPAATPAAELPGLAGLLKQIFDRQPEFRAVAAAMPPNLTAWGLAGRPFDPRVIPESYLLLRELPSFDLRRRPAAADELVQTLSPRYPAVRIPGGWTLTGGRTPTEAFDRLEVAEFSALAALNSADLGGMRPISDRQVAELVQVFRLPG